MQYKQILVLVLVIILTAVTTYFVSHPKPDTNPYYLRKIQESLIREDSIKAELNKTLAQIKEYEKEDKSIVAIYDTITKPTLIRRADSIYFRHGLHRD